MSKYCYKFCFVCPGVAEDLKAGEVSKVAGEDRGNLFYIISHNVAYHHSLSLSLSSA